jgi:uncharacterized protein (TIGR02001 family)
MYWRVNAALFFKLVRYGIYALGLLWISPARAENNAPVDHITASLGLTSDYRFRGVSYSGKQPALQAELMLADNAGWFAGVWTSVVIAGPRAGDEIDLYAGRSGELGGLAYSFSAYVYMDGEASHVQYAEFQALLSRHIGPASLQLEASSAPKQRRDAPGNLYLAATALIPVIDPRLTVRLHAGRENGFFANKIDWEAGLSHRLGVMSFSAAAVGSWRAGFRQPDARWRAGTGVVLSANASF